MCYETVNSITLVKFHQQVQWVQSSYLDVLQSLHPQKQNQNKTKNWKLHSFNLYPPVQLTEVTRIMSLYFGQNRCLHTLQRDFKRNRRKNKQKHNKQTKTGERRNNERNLWSRALVSSFCLVSYLLGEKGER